MMWYDGLWYLHCFDSRVVMGLIGKIQDLFLHNFAEV